MEISSKQFLDIALTNNCYTVCKYVLQQLPYEYTSSYIPGSSSGPAAIIKASAYVELYDEVTNSEAYKAGIVTLSPTYFNSAVDEEAMNIIKSSTLKLLNDNKFVISLASEHTATYGIIQAFIEKFSDLTILQIDAHADLRESYYDKTGNLNRYSHACVMKRIYDLNVPIVQVGIRALSKEEALLIDATESIKTIFAHNIDQNDNSWLDRTLQSIDSKNVYITIDADGLDPSIAPAVGTPEPNGLSFNQVSNLMNELVKQKNVIGFDVLECVPLPTSIITEYTLAKLVYRIISYLENK